MANQYQCWQCPKCNSIELPTAVFCSQCGQKFQNSSFYSVKHNNKNIKQLVGAGIVGGLLVLALGAFVALVSISKNERPAPYSTKLQPSPEVTPELISAFPDSKPTFEGKVVGVSDGDTITVLDKNNQQIKIRLEGIDAPESSQDFGEKAKQNLSDLIYGKVVQVFSSKKDKYGRTVGKILLGGRDINLEQIKSGFAWHYKDYAAEQSEADRTLYADAEAKAKGAKLGLWILPNPTPPWSFRKGASINPADADKIFGNKNSFIYHWAGCPGFTKISKKNRVVFNSTAEAEDAGYRPAENCSTPKPEPETEKIFDENLEVQNFEPQSEDLIVVQTTPAPKRLYSEAPKTETAPRPVYVPTPTYSYPRETETTERSATATALCADGTYSYSLNNRGTCSHHGGVSVWLNGSGSRGSSSYSPRSPSTESYRPKDVYVRGYTRKDGTYVQPYYRSRPRRKN